ncbi:MAG TPA: hypothetical protein PLD40_04855 [Kiritimatiellia bacterium]|nr:hypothetical protein [Kiritimatiellia bacterium]HOR73838.1 hypothetical protein [Kiritimatiellia bacterium]HOU58487.1 hypothetical protein [Kiritimatiellia bacterium]HPK69546.1 hypothetical protein [Kiritimatiellia bacterium]HPV46893.1 hypothetical protein [Kiritimatiellia bacterium]
MSDISRALQNKLSRKGQLKEQAEEQLDLFASLADHTPTPRFITPPPPATPRPEPAMILPPATPKSAPSEPPTDIMADVRAALSDSSVPRPSEPASDNGLETRPPLRTGIYHRPQRLAFSLPEPPPPPPPGSSPWQKIKAWFAGAELDRRMIALIVVLLALAALIGFWSGCPSRAPESATTAEPAEGSASETAASAAPAQPAVPTAPAPATPAPAAPATPAAPAKPAATLAAADASWQIAGAESFQKEGGIFIRYAAPIFVSADNISVEGMRALKATAARLARLENGARVQVTGHTDDVPLSAPTAKFKCNEDIAAARAKVAMEHLSAMTRANKKLSFEPVTGAPQDAPFPNDTPQNRRLNRTVTVQVFPAP